jgi:O-antigen/teichoic acid export membrane protein
MPILCLLIVVAEPVISWLYSDKWIACVPYFRILCVAGVVKSIINVHYFSIAAKGRSKLLFRLTLVQSVWGVVCMLVGVYVGGVYGLLWGMVLSVYTNYMMYAVLSSNITGYKLMMQLRDLLPILCVAALTAIATYYVGTLFHAPVFLTFVLQALVYGGVYVGCSLLFQLRSIQWLKELVRSIRKK